MKNSEINRNVDNFLKLIDELVRSLSQAKEDLSRKELYVTAYYFQLVHYCEAIAYNYNGGHYTVIPLIFRSLFELVVDIELIYQEPSYLSDLASSSISGQKEFIQQSFDDKNNRFYKELINSDLDRRSKIKDLRTTINNIKKKSGSDKKIPGMRDKLGKLDSKELYYPIWRMSSKSVHNDLFTIEKRFISNDQGQTNVNFQTNWDTDDFTPHFITSFQLTFEMTVFIFNHFGLEIDKYKKIKLIKLLKTISNNI